MVIRRRFETISAKLVVLGVMFQQKCQHLSQNAASQSQAEIGNLISQTEDKIRDYKTAKSAIEEGDQLIVRIQPYSFYQTYKIKVKKIR